MFRYKMNVQEKLKEAGYSTYRLRKEKILPDGTLYKFRTGSASLSLESLDVVCTILHCQLSDILEWVPNDSASEPPGPMKESRKQWS